MDYSTLEIRHLGSIYEGLLEYKLRVADEDMVVNGGEWVNISDYNKDRKQKKVFSDFDEFDRVKQGNSLIGARLEDLPYYPDTNGKKKERKVKDAAQQTFEVEIERPFFDKIVKILNSLTDINDDTIENIHKKKDIFEKLMNSPEYQRIRAFANLHTAIYFGVVTTKVDRQPRDGYNDILWALREDEEGWRRKTNREWFGKARRLAQEKSFFHWELEFPELFFEGGAPKENPGWDAVVGNPPYGASLDENDRTYLGLNYETATGYREI